MQFIERARCALRDWLNKPSRQEHEIEGLEWALAAVPDFLAGKLHRGDEVRLLQRMPAANRAGLLAQRRAIRLAARPGVSGPQYGTPRSASSPAAAPRPIPEASQGCPAHAGRPG